MGFEKGLEKRKGRNFFSALISPPYAEYLGRSVKQTALSSSLQVLTQWFYKEGLS